MTEEEAAAEAREDNYWAGHGGEYVPDEDEVDRDLD